jgi:uncharacterized protein (DUF2267 family)
MQYREFVEAVMQMTGLQAPEAETSVAAVLETLGELIPRTERDNVAAQLPNELKSAFSSERDHDSFELEEFYNRVSSRADVGYEDAVDRSMGVTAVFKRAVSGGELEDVMSVLPPGYGELFSEKASGPLSPSQGRS